jgi:SAM-dependent methyltransferase
MAVKTYSTMHGSPLAFARDAWDLWRIRTKRLKEHAGNAAANAHHFDDELTAELGSGLAGKKVLIVGPGQTLREWWAFSTLGAEVTGIDLDVVPVGFDLPAYAALLRTNGPVRFAKTVGRKLLGIDRAFEHALALALGVPRLKPGRLIAADATNLPFASGAFDVVFSFSVFEHLDAPDAVMQEITRVLKPGGFASISVHLYASEGGCHDLRIFAGKREGIPLWAQLRPAHQHTVQESCYLNKLRTADFERLFTQQWPGVRFALDHHQGARDGELRSALTGLRAAGELGGYTDTELLSVNLLARWKRPEVAYV